jgi:hypothetical protein
MQVPSAIDNLARSAGAKFEEVLLRLDEIRRTRKTDADFQFLDKIARRMMEALDKRYTIIHTGSGKQPDFGSTLKHGELSKRGYSVSNKKRSRHRALRKTVRSLGALSTFRKLNAVSTLTKRTSKGKSKTFKTDRNWVKKTFMK